MVFFTLRTSVPAEVEIGVLPPWVGGTPCSLVWRLAWLWEHSPGVHGALVSCSVWWGREILVNTAWEEEWNGQRMRLRNGCVNRQVEGGQGAWEQHSNAHVSNSWWEKALTCRGGRLCRAPGHMCPRGWQGPGHSGIALGARPVRASLWACVWKDHLAPSALSAPGKVWFKAKTPELFTWILWPSLEQGNLGIGLHVLH